MKKYALILITGLILTGCALDKKPPPAGERIGFSASELSVGTKIQKYPISLSQSRAVSDWKQAGYNAAHLMPHSNVSDALTLKWDKNVGDGLDRNHLVLAKPIVQNGVIYTLDATFHLTATDLNDGKRLWRQKLSLGCEDFAIQSIGLAYQNNKIFAVGGDGSLYAVDTNGKIVWQKNLRISLRAEPVVYDNTLYLLAANNKLFAINTKDGSEKWVYQTTSNQTNLLGMGSPAIHNDKLIVGFSTGEVMAFNALTGTPLWTQNVLSSRTYNKILDLAHIVASPVIQNDTVYIIGNARKIAAFNINTGDEVFSNTLSGHSTPALSGNTLFVLVDKNNLVAMNKQNGKVAWETALPTNESEIWKGPILLKDKALVVSNQGQIVMIQLKTGEIKHSFKIGKTSTQPIISGKHLIFLTDDADLVVYEG